MSRNPQKRKSDKTQQPSSKLDEKHDQILNKILTTVPIAAWEWPRPLLCVLKERAISYADQVLDPLWLIAAQGVTPIFQAYTRTDLARNRAAMELLKSNYTHLIMLDIDHSHPADIVQKLSYWFIRQKLKGEPKDMGVVGGLNFRRSSPHDPCCHLFGEDGYVYAPAEWEKGLMKVDAIGTGSIMIAREVFNEIQPPWFFNLYDNVWEDAWPGEDMGFSQKCREYGIGMYVDTTLTSPHIGEYQIAEANFRHAIKQDNLQVQKTDNFKRMKF